MFIVCHNYTVGGPPKVFSVVVGLKSVPGMRVQTHSESQRPKAAACAGLLSRNFSRICRT